MKQIEVEYRSGVSTNELAVRYNVSAWAITAHLHSVGVPMRLRRVGPEDLRRAAELYATGLSFDQVGSQLGFAGCTLYRAFTVAGLPMRRRR